MSASNDGEDEAEQENEKVKERGSKKKKTGNQGDLEAKPKSAKGKGAFDLKSLVDKAKRSSKKESDEKPNRSHEPAENPATGLVADGNYIVKFDVVTKLPLKKRGEPADKREERIRLEKAYG